ncbi:MAG: radical SAM protein [Candidatus Paceibacterota bacterium]|jgi:radical SAM superfamily enzyme YgiQ (UPF0313 family)
MKNLDLKGSWPLIRFIIPMYPELNIYSGTMITSLGPISVATSADKIMGLRVEVIDENIYTGPLDQDGFPDHAKLQEESPASFIGIYCGLSSTMDRVYKKIIPLYHEKGVVTIAGGRHTHYMAEEALDNNFDIVVHGNGEHAIYEILTTLIQGGSLNNIPGISFREEEKTINNPPSTLVIQNLDDLPYPNFGLLKYAKKLEVYPLGIGQGCGHHCEFCSVNEPYHCASAEHVFNLLNWLVSTRKAKKFFIVDDRLEQNPKNLSHFLELVKEKYGDKLHFIAQVRMEIADNIKLMEAMRAAGVRTVPVGFESPIDEDLKSMNKGYTSKDMVRRALILKKYFDVHAMLIFGYPKVDGEQSKMSGKEMVRRFKWFIKASEFSTIQMMKPMPLVGSDLRIRLEAEGRIFPLKVVPWSKYDGNYVCFIPDNNLTSEELQKLPIEIMSWFYNPLTWIKISVNALAFPVYCLIGKWKIWYSNFIDDLIKYGGSRLLKKWKRKQQINDFIHKLEIYVNR